MSNFVNVVHPDLPGQVGRISTAALPANAEKGWAIAEEDDLGPNPRSRFVEEARSAIAEARLEVDEAETLALAEAELAELHNVVAKHAPEPEPKAKPKPKKPKTEEKQ